MSSPTQLARQQPIQPPGTRLRALTFLHRARWPAYEITCRTIDPDDLARKANQ